MTVGTPLKRVALVAAGQSPPSAEVRDFAGEGRPFLQGNAEFGAEHPTPLNRCDSNVRVAAAGDVLVSVRAPVGALNIADREYGIGRGLAAIRPTPELHARFCWWWMHAAADILKAEATGSTYDSVTAEEIGALRLPECEPERQRVVADFLDDETARIDALITKKRDLAARVEDRLWLLRSWLVLGGAEASQDHPVLGRVNPKWEVRRIKHAVPRVGVGVVVDPSTYFAATGVPFIHGSNVRDGWIETTDTKRMSEEDSRILWRSRLEAGDVVVVRAGYPGRAAVVPTELAGANCASILILKRGDLLRPEFLAAFFNSGAARSQVWAAQYGAAQEQINVGHIVNFVIPAPPLSEQDRIVERLAAVEGTVRQLITRLERQIRLLFERRSALIAAAVTGQFQIPGLEA